MNKILSVFLFIFLTGALWFLWKGYCIQDFFNSSTEISEEDSAENKKSMVKGVRRKETVSVKLPAVEAPLEVEVVADENGVFLNKIGNLEVNQQLSDKEVYSLDIKNGILKFWEIHTETNNLKFKSINLVEFLIQMEVVE